MHIIDWMEFTIIIDGSVRFSAGSNRLSIFRTSLIGLHSYQRIHASAAGKWNSWLEFTSTQSPSLFHPSPPRLSPPPGDTQRKITPWHLQLRTVETGGPTVWQWDDSRRVIISLINLPHRNKHCAFLLLYSATPAASLLLANARTLHVCVMHRQAPIARISSSKRSILRVLIFETRDLKFYKTHPTTPRAKHKN